MTHQQNPADRQEPHRGKVDNDHNKLGATKPTQKNEGERSPQSRHDREAKVGGGNQTKSRNGPAGGSGH